MSTSEATDAGLRGVVGVAVPSDMLAAVQVVSAGGVSRWGLILVPGRAFNVQSAAWPAPLTVAVASKHRVADSGCAAVDSEVLFPHMPPVPQGRWHSVCPTPSFATGGPSISGIFHSPIRTAATFSGHGCYNITLLPQMSAAAASQFVRRGRSPQVGPLIPAFSVPPFVLRLPLQPTYAVISHCCSSFTPSSFDRFLPESPARLRGAAATYIWAANSYIRHLQTPKVA